MCGRTKAWQWWARCAAGRQPQDGGIFNRSEDMGGRSYDDEGLVQGRRRRAHTFHYMAGGGMHPRVLASLLGWAMYDFVVLSSVPMGPLT